MGTSRPKMDKEERRKMELADKFKNPPISRNWVCESSSQLAVSFCKSVRMVLRVEGLSGIWMRPC